MKQEILDEAIKYIDSWLAFRYSRLEIPGFTVSIQHKDRLVYSKAFGFANLEAKTEMTTGHIFRIASHSKTFTATSILQLQDNGKLKLDDPVIRHIPWLAKHQDKRWQNVTLRQLLSHSAGVIRDGLDCDYWAVERPFPDFEEFKRELLRAELVIDNNTKLKYSNYGYTLLGLVVEAASDEKYNDYVKHHIIDTLGLKNTGPEYEQPISDKFVTGYTRRDLNKQRLPIDNVDTRAMASATGFFSTAEDLCAYGAAHFWDSDKLLSEESKKEMQRVQWSGKFAGEREEYGLGFGLEEIDERHTVGHGGGFPGQITKTLFDPKEKIVVSVLTNCIDGSAGAINKAIYRIIDWFVKANEKKSVHDLKKFEGRFMTLWSVEEIVAAGDRILAVNPDTWTPFKDPEELEYVNATTLKIKKTSSFSSASELIRFTFENGKPVKIVNAGASMYPEEQYLDMLRSKTIISL